MRSTPFRLLAAATLTAILLDLPFPIAGPLPIWRTFFAWIALVPLLVALLWLPGAQCEKPLRWSFFTGWWCGALWFGANCYWVYGTMHTYGNMNAAMAVICLVLFSIYLGFWFGAFALALTVIRKATMNLRWSWLAFVSIPFLWTAMEFAIARIPEFPWDLLGYSQIDNALLMRLAPWTGVYGISFVLAGVNALFAVGLSIFGQRRIARQEQRSFVSHSDRLFVVSGFAFVFAAAFGYTVTEGSPATQAIAVLIQPNLSVDADDVWVGADWDRHIAQFTQLGTQSCKSYIAGMPQTDAKVVSPQCPAASAPPTLIVWPEAPAPFRDLDPRFQTAMKSIVAADKAPLTVGTIGMTEDESHQTHFFNSASIFAQDGHLIGRYDKIHLVPFGEYIPFRKLLFFARQLTDQLSDMGNGDNRRAFPIASSDGQTHGYGIFICYESVFGDEVRQFALHGSEVLVNISDDGWYGDTSAPWQHLNMARMRAIENRRWILRDTNTGVTASIDPYGIVRQSIPRHQVDALPARFGYNSELTFYTLHGDVLPVICAILSLALALWSGRALLWQNATSQPERQ